MTTEHRDAFFRRGCTLRMNGRADLAAREFERAVEADPQHARSFAMLAYCRNDLGDARAVDTSLTAVSLDPSDAFNHRARGWTLIGAQRAPEALAPAREALTLSPRETESFVLLAEVLLRTADYDGALRATDGALALHPEHATAHRQRAVALRHLGRLDEAQSAAEQALALEPDAFWSHLIMARTAAARMDADGSARSFREALRLDPSSAEARSGLVLAMKTRNRAYRTVTRLHLWFFRLPRLVRLAIVIPAMFLTAGFGAFLILPVMIAGHATDPLANLVLRFDRYGRHLLTPKQIVSSDAFLMIALAACGGVGVAVLGLKGTPALAAAFVGAWIPIALCTRNCRPGRSTLWMRIYAASLILCPAAYVWVESLERTAPDLWSRIGIAATLLMIPLFLFPLIGVPFAFKVAGRCGYPWSHRFDAPSR